MEPLISVIVPIYKVEEYLNRCVESLVNQTYKNLEIILVDDGSPDNCPEMCDRWAKQDKRIRVIHKKNGGLSDARNAGMRIATGEYIAFVDSDDLVSYSFFEDLLYTSQSTNAELSACEVESFSDEAEIQLTCDNDKQITVFNAEQALSQLIRGRGFRAVAWNKLYRASLLTDEHFEFGRLHEDEFFTYRIIDKCKTLSFVDKPLYKYRQREGSIMTVKSDKHLDSLDAGYQRLQLFRTKYPALYSYDKVTFCVCCFNVYVQALEEQYLSPDKAKKMVKHYRSRIKFSFHEMLRMNRKNRLYVIASMPIWIDFFSNFKIRKSKV